MGFRLAPSDLTLDDPEGSKVDFDSKYLENGNRYEIASPENTYMQDPRAFDWHRQI